MVYIIDPQNAGISGNMIIGALVDLGADGEKVKCLMEDVAVCLVVGLLGHMVVLFTVC